MPIQPPASLIDALRRRKCVLFVGAGLSAWAKLPGWGQLIGLLLQRMHDEFPGDDALAELATLKDAGKLLEVADYCRERLGAHPFYEFLKKHLRGVNEPIPEPHRVIVGLPFYVIVTTNYDKLLERAFMPIVPVTPTHADTAQLGMLEYSGESVFILKAHGDIDRPDTIVLTASDYRFLIHDNRAFAETFSGILRSNAILFLGYSLTDPDFRLLLDRQLSIFGGNVPPRFALMRNVGPVERDVLRRTAALNVFSYDDHGDVLDFLQALSQRIAPAAPAPVLRPGIAAQPEAAAAPPVVAPATTPETDETAVSIPTRKRPTVDARGTVFILPDFVGSDLSTVGPDGRPELIWMQFMRLVRGEFVRLHTGSGEKIVATAVNRRSYEALIGRLSEHWEVMPFPYDWRLDVNEPAARLNAVVEEACAQGRACHIVADGMGALVARTLIANHPATWSRMARPKAGGRLVMIGPLNHGCFEVLRTITGMAQFVRQLAMLDVTHDVKELLPIFHSFLSLWQMLPSPLCLPEMAPLYEARTYGGLAVAQPLLNQALAQHQRLRGVVDVERMMIIAGTGQPTPAGVTGFDRLDSADVYTTTLDGDGRVTTELARLHAADGREVPCLYVAESHTDMLGNEALLLAIGDLLSEGHSERLPAEPPASR